MKKITKGHPLTQSPDFIKNNIETLKTLFPTIVKEGKIDFEELRALLDENLETEDEYYRFTWAGKSMTIFCDPEVKFGGVKVGGIRISHMTDIESDMAVCLNTTKGKKGEFKIRKLASVRSKSALSELLTEAAKNGTQSLRSIWGKTLSEAERQSFGNACPEKIKQAAADVDSAVPKNLAQGSE